MVRFISILYLLAVSGAYASWQYTNGTGTGTQGGFTYQTTVTETSANTFTGTATLTAFSGSSASIPPTAPIQITVNTTNSEGQPIQYNKTVNCAVKGFSEFTLDSDAAFTGNMNIIGNFDLKGHMLTVIGDVNQKGAVYMSGGTLTAVGWNQSAELNLGGGILNIEGNLIHQSGRLILAGVASGGFLEVTGDYLQQRDADGDGSYEGYCTGYLDMGHTTDHMLVLGNAQFWNASGYSSPYPNWLAAGVLEIKGNFVQKTAANSFANTFHALGTHRTLLSGTATQTVTFESPGSSYFNTLEVTNPVPLVVNSPVQASKVTGNTLISIQSPGEGGISGSFESDVSFTGNAFTILSETSLGGHSLTVNCPVKQLGFLNLSGGILTITGTGGWDQRSGLTIGANGRLTVPGSFIHQSGDLIFGGGRLEIIGDYLQQRDADGDGSYEAYCYGSVTMNNAADYLLVCGNAQFYDYSYTYASYSTYSAGTVEVRGNFSQKYDSNGCYSYYADHTHRTLFSGSETQTVTFESPSDSHFGILEVTNPTSVVFASVVLLQKLIGHSTTIQSSTSANTLMIPPSPTWFDVTGVNIMQSVISCHSNQTLVKVGTGTLALNAENTWTGGTVVYDGTLGGTGSVIGPVWIYSGGALAPGTSGIGTLTTGELNLRDGSCYAVETDSSATPAADVTHVTGNIALAGVMNVSDLAAAPVVLPSGNKLTVLTYSGTLTGTFIGKAEGTTFKVGLNTFKIRYQDSNAVTLEAANSFTDWAAANAPGQSADQDHDHDGVANGIEYFMGRSGNDFTANPGIVNGTATWPKSPAYSGSYAVQTSTDLVEWADVTADAAQVTKNADSVIWTRPIGTGSRFVRLLVTPN